MEKFREGKGSEIKPMFEVLVGIQTKRDRWIRLLPHKYHTGDHTLYHERSDFLKLAVFQAKFAKQSVVVSVGI